MDSQYIKSILHAWFSYPQNKVYCQVSTIAYKNPHIRTMDLYEITEDGCFVFFTDTSTRKWLDLQECENIAICIVHLEYGQLIIEGKTTLKTNINDFNTVSFYWHNFLDQYWRDFYLSGSSSLEKKIPSSFGIMIVKPFFVEVLEINKQDFLRSSRKQFQLIDGVWGSKDVMPI